MLAAPFPQFYLTGFRDWLLEGKSPSGMPAVVNFLKETSKCGYDVHITLPIFGTKTKCKAFMREDHIIVHPYRLPSLLLPLIYILRKKGHFLLNYIFVLLTLILSFEFHRKLIFRLYPHFIYQMGYNMFLGNFLHKLTNYPLVYRLFGTVIWERMGRSIRKLSPWQKIRCFSEFYIYRHPGSLIVMSNDGTRGDKVMEFFGVPKSKILFLLNGIDIETNSSSIDIRKGTSQEAFLAVAMARLVGWKGIDRILRALPESVKLVPELNLVVIGDGSQRKLLERLTVSLGISNIVRFLGSIPHNKIIDTLKQGDLFISTQYFSNLSNCLFEAILAGLPIISLADGSLVGFLENGVNSILLDPQNIKRDLPQAIEKIARDRAFYRRLKKGIIEKSNEIWTWQERIAFELKTIENIISKRRT